MLSRGTLEGLHVTGKIVVRVCYNNIVILLFTVKSFKDVTLYLVRECLKTHWKITLANNKVGVAEMKIRQFSSVLIMRQLFMYKSLRP